LELESDKKARQRFAAIDKFDSESGMNCLY
jgi:hypothetical protein